MTAATLDRYWETLSRAVAALAPEEQPVAVTLYQRLAKGAPVCAERFAGAFGLSVAEGRNFDWTLGRAVWAVR